MSTQHGWHICFKCNSIFFGGGAKQGICAAGGAHDASFFDRPAVNFTIEIETQPVKANVKKWAASPVNSESGWRRCHKCECLFHADRGSNGTCPADDQGHEGHKSLPYKIAIKSLSNQKAADVKMRKCKKCLGMFWDSNWTPGVKSPDHAGLCPGKPKPDFPHGVIKSHNAEGSKAYALTPELAASSPA